MKDHIYKPLIKQLVDAREKLGLTRVSVSKQLGFPQGCLSRLERGQYDLKASTLIELSRFYGLEIILAPKQLVPEFRSLLQNSSESESESEPAFVPLGDEDDEDDDDGE